MSLPAPYWTSPDGRHVIYCADCLTVLPHLSPAASSCASSAEMRNCGGLNLTADAVVTDPPYGIDWQGCNASTLKWDGISQDDGTLDLRKILTMPCAVLSFGANCYPSQLPHRGRWLCWDKRTIDGACDAMLGSPMELAWANKTSGFDKIVRCLHGGVVNADGGKRVHPTQKPTQVMIEAIEWAAKDCSTILDPFMGSGTTGVACIRTGRRFIGVEIEPKYCAIAVERMERELAQPCLPSLEPQQAKQEALL